MKRVMILCLALALAAFAPVVAFAEEDTSTVSLTTGLPIDHANKFVTVQIDNEPKARPQKGLAAADVVYEIELYNGGYTRYTAVFNDTIPTLVEAVRSMRISNLDLHMNWDGMFVHYGGQSYAGRNAFDYAKAKKLTEVEGMSSGEFKRDSARKAPNNVYCNLVNVQALKDYAIDPARKTPLTFDADAQIEGEDAKAFEIIYKKGSYQPGYTYDEDEGLYYRTYNENPHKDGDTGEQLTCANVIVMRVDTSWHDGMSDAPIHKLTGKGKCEYFIDGKHFSGTWSRDAVENATEYYDQDGDLVAFRPGKTFIQIAKDKVEVAIGG
jgi:hypothetical protein